MRLPLKEAAGSPIILAVFLLAACQAGGPARDIGSLSDISWDDRAIFREGLITSERQVLDGLPGASVYHIDLTISDDLLYLKGHQEVRYTNREDEELTEIYLRLFPNVTGGSLTVSAVEVGGEQVFPSYEFAESALRVPIPSGLEPGQDVVVTMDFQVEVTTEMGGNYGLFGYFNEILVLDEFYPVVAVYDEEGWNVEIPAHNGDLTHLDASFYLVRVTAPEDLVVVGSGIEVGRSDQGGTQVVTFAAGPARDFYLAASRDYEVVSRTVGETRINSYALSSLMDGAEQALDFTEVALKILEDRIGTYPYTEYDVVSTPMQALGIEYPGIVGITLQVYDFDNVVMGLPAVVILESVIAHEAAHQWFYNVIGNDQVDEPWLDEALAQYATGLYYLDSAGPEVERQYQGSWDSRWETVKREDIPIGLPAGAYSSEAYGPIIYGRGPYFVVELAREMGQQAFDQFLHDYYQSFKWEISTTEAFETLAEYHCDCDLTDLFEAWVFEK